MENRYEQFKKALTRFGIGGTEIKIKTNSEEETQKLFESMMKIFNEYAFCGGRQKLYDFERFLPEFCCVDAQSELFLIRNNTSIKVEYLGALKEEGWGDYYSPLVYKIKLKNDKFEYIFKEYVQHTATTHRVEPLASSIVPKLLKNHEEFALKLFTSKEIEELKKIK